MFFSSEGVAQHEVGRLRPAPARSTSSSNLSPSQRPLCYVDSDCACRECSWPLLRIKTGGLDVPFSERLLVRRGRASPGRIGFLEERLVTMFYAIVRTIAPIRIVATRKAPAGVCDDPQAATWRRCRSFGFRIGMIVSRRAPRGPGSSLESLAAMFCRELRQDYFCDGDDVVPPG